MATRDGDIDGGDFPGWLPTCSAAAARSGLADRRGECIHAACPHYHNCFIEAAIRRARAGRHRGRQPCAGDDPGGAGPASTSAALPTPLRVRRGPPPVRRRRQRLLPACSRPRDRRAAALAARRRGRPRRRARGLQAADRGTRRRRRGGREGARPPRWHAAPRAARRAAGRSASPRARRSARPRRFLALVRRQVYARAPATRQPLRRSRPRRCRRCDGTAPRRPPALERALAPARAAACAAGRRGCWRGSTTRPRSSTPRRGCASRRCRAASSAAARSSSPAGAPCCEALGQAHAARSSSTGSRVERIDGREVDVGLHRHWLDPTAPFAEAVAAPAHGAAGHLRDPDRPAATRSPRPTWARGRGAQRRPPSAHAGDPRRACPRPSTTRRRPAPSSSPTCAGRSRPGGRRPIARCSWPPAAARSACSPRSAGCAPCTAASPAAGGGGHPALAQHVDALDTATLVDIFRAEEDACLLGTDAVRDGVDVPGRSLRLLVFDRVPWPRPDILHKARRSRLRRQAGYDDAHRPAAAAAGLRPADPPRRRPRRLRAARPA